MGLNTRTKNLNTYTQNNDFETLYSNVDTVLYDNEIDLTLLNYNDFILKQGIYISDDKSLNPNTEYEINGHPEKWQLDYKQQFNNCGVESVMNIMAINGSIDITDETWSELAFTYKALAQGLCQDENGNGVVSRLGY